MIIGGSGFIGTHLALKLREGYKVFATFNRHPIFMRGVTTMPVRMQDKDWVKRIVYISQPDVIIYAAGTNDLEFAEKNTREAEFIHTGAAVGLSDESDMFQSRFIYLSNCYVFDGIKGNYRETDTVMPMNALGKLKLSGENFIKSKSLNYILVRMSPLIGRGNGFVPSFLDHLKTQFEHGRKMEFSSQEVFNFAPIEPLALLMEKIIESGVRKKTLHYGGLTKVSYYDFARLLAQRFGYDTKLVTSSVTSASHMPHGVNVLDYSLNFTNIVETLKIKPLFLEECFDLIQQKLIPGF